LVIRDEPSTLLGTAIDARTVSGGYLLAIGPGELDAEPFAADERDLAQTGDEPNGAQRLGSQACVVRP
jgi:hypothetical protein